MRDVIEPVKQLSVSGQWPLAQRLYGIGRINYSLKDGKMVDSVMGMEYKADCWAFRLSAQHFVTTSKNSSTAIFIQLELNGLSKIGVGNNPLDSLSRNIRRPQ